MRLTLLFALGAMAALARAAAPPLRVSMIALGVTDMARSVRFYGETLELALQGKPGEVAFFRAGEMTILLNGPLGHAAGSAVAGAVEVIFPVESVTASHRDLAARGCVFVREPREVTPGTWAATFTDPDGHKLTILGPR